MDTFELCGYKKPDLIRLSQLGSRFKMNVLKPVISKFALFLCAGLFVQTCAAQVATLEGTTIKMPVVVVGTSQFSVDLSLNVGSDPITFSLAAASETNGGDTTNAPFLEGAVLKIPTLAIDGTDFFVDLTLTGNAPVTFQLTNFGANTVSPPASDELRVQALAFFQQNVDQQIINSRCVNCHVQGGNAGNTPLIYQRQSATSTAVNFGVIEAYLQSRQDGAQTILSKSLGDSHSGGAQLTGGSTDFANFSEFLTLLANSLSGS
jgi:hypothetical protein